MYAVLPMHNSMEGMGVGRGSSDSVASPSLVQALLLPPPLPLHLLFVSIKGSANRFAAAMHCYE